MAKSRGSRRAQLGRQSRPLNFESLGGVPQSERGPDGEVFQVQRVRGSEKTYTCPGCLQAIRPQTAHVVAWPEEAPFGRAQGVDARRHWHADCWRRGLRPQ